MNERDYEILLAGHRYKVIDKQFLHQTIFTGLTEKAVERKTTRFQAQSLLQPVPLSGRHVAYTLTPKAASLVGVSPKPYERPMGAQAIFANYAILRHCLASSGRCKRLTPAEFLKHMPQLNQRGLTTNRYHWDRDEQAKKSRLSLFVVDCGQHQRRIVRKARREVEKRLRFEAWKPVVANDLFAVTIITPFERKADFLRAKLAEESWKSTISVLPELAALTLEPSK
jgi:hypothetical protein